MLLSVVLQGSILGAILFNLFINELLFFIEQAKLTNFAQDNAIYVGSKYLTEIIEILQKECKTAINWFKTNNIIVNRYKFQSMIISSKKDLIKSVLRSQNTFFSWNRKILFFLHKTLERPYFNLHFKFHDFFPRIRKIWKFKLCLFSFQT